MHTKLRLIAGLLVLAVTLGGLYFVRYFNIVESTEPLPLITEGCTMEAKICPDGSSVGRTGPDCSFAACPAAPVPKKIVVPAPAPLPSWKTYANESFGFNLDYPATATVATLFTRAYHATESWSQKGGVAKGKPIVAFLLPEVVATIDGRTERLAVGELRIGESTDPADVASCLSPDENDQDLGQQMLGGEQTQVSIISSTEMSQFVVGKSYRLIRNGSCIAVEPIIAGITPGPLSSNEAEYDRISTIVSGAVREMNQTLDSMMATLHFSTTTIEVATTTPQS